jgi:hypothetical protein
LARRSFRTRITICGRSGILTVVSTLAIDLAYN